MKTEIEIEGIPFETVGEALQHVDAAGRGVVVSVDGIGGYLVVERPMADRLDEAGLLGAYYHEREMPDGSFRVVSVPVRD